MLRLLLNWILSAVAVWVVAQVVRGVYVSGWKSALIAALVIGFINATIGFVLKIITFPLTVVTLGIFWLIINALMIAKDTWNLEGGSFQHSAFSVQVLHECCQHAFQFCRSLVQCLVVLAFDELQISP